MALACIAGARILVKQAKLQQTYDRAAEVVHAGTALQAAFERLSESVADSLLIRGAAAPPREFEQRRFAVETRLGDLQKSARTYAVDPTFITDITEETASGLALVRAALATENLTPPGHLSSQWNADGSHPALRQPLALGFLSLSTAEEKAARLVDEARHDMARLTGQAAQNFRMLFFLAAAVVLCAIAALFVGFRAIHDLETSRTREQGLRALDGLSPLTTGPETFGSLASLLGTLTGCPFVIVARIKDDGGVVRTLALWSRDRSTAIAESSLTNTPCGAVVRDGQLHVEKGIRQLYPEDEDLRRMQAVGYAGHSLRDPDGKTIGALLLIDRKPLRFTEAKKDLFEIFARRAEIELFRLLSIEALTASESRHRMVLASLADGVLTINKTGVIQSMNPAAEHLFGWTAGELLGLKVWSLISPGHHETLRQGLVRHQSAFLSSRTERSTVEVEGIHSTGFNFPMDVSLSCHAVDDEVIYTAILRDTSERRRMEGEVRRLARAAESAADAIIMSDRLGQITWVNSAFTSITGYTKEEAIGRNPRLLKSELQAPEFYRELWTTISSGRPWSGQLINRRKDQSLYHASLTIAPLFNRAGEVDGYVAIQRDVTNVVEREKELIRLQQELQRKADLSERQNRDLQLAREAALEASRIKSEFLANMSHEIRTPMNGILGFVDLLLETELSREQRDYLDTVQVSGESLMVVINDILDFSKIEAGKINLECTEFDLRELVESVGDLLAPSAQAKGLEFICAVSPDAPSILRGDPTRLRQVLINLTGNAIKFTDAGEVCLYAERGRIQDGCSSVQFRVADTGIGIPEEQRESLFQPFSQVDGSTTRRHGGTGLGLAISHRLVGLMNGHIELESVPWEGSVFTVHLRLDMSKDAPADLHFLPAGMDGARVLVVDDNRTNRIHLQAMLESFGCETTCVGDPEDAVRVVQERDRIGHSFSFILLDHDIAGFSSRDLALRLREAGCTTPLINMGVARGDRPDPAVFQAWTCKPIKQFALFEAVAQISMGRDQAGNVEDVEEVPPQRAHAHPGRPLHILLAEDNPINQKVATVLLERMGHRVVVAADGAEAVEAVRTASFDIVLMDVQMPVLDGYEATAQIRSVERERHLPIIAMTARAMKGDRELCIEAGMDDYVTKPVRQKALESVLQRWTQIPGPDRLLGSAPVPDAEAMLDALFAEGTAKDAAEKKTAAGGLGAFFAQPAGGATERHSEILSRLEEIGILDDPVLMSETIGAFVPDSRRAMEELRSAIDSGDPVTCERIAHRLRGACLNLGATRLGEMAGILEEKGRRGDLNDAEGIYAAMAVLFSDLSAFLERLIRNKAA